MAQAPCRHESPVPSKSRALSLLGLVFILFGKAEGDSTPRILALRTACDISDDNVSIKNLFCGGSSHCQDAILDLAESLNDSGAPRDVIFSAFSSGCPLPTYEPTTQSPERQANQVPTVKENLKAGVLAVENSGARPQGAIQDGGISGSWADDGRSIVDVVRRLQASLTEVTKMPGIACSNCW